MRDILADLENWLAQDKPAAIATVVQTWGSSPPPTPHLARSACKKTRLQKDILRR